MYVQLGLSDKGRAIKGFDVCWSLPNIIPKIKKIQGQQPYPYELIVEVRWVRKERETKNDD